MAPYGLRHSAPGVSSRFPTDGLKNTARPRALATSLVGGTTTRADRTCLFSACFSALRPFAHQEELSRHLLGPDGAHMPCDSQPNLMETHAVSLASSIPLLFRRRSAGAAFALVAAVALVDLAARVVERVRTTR